MKWLNTLNDSVSPRLMGRTAGMVSNATGAPDVESSVATIVLTAILGAFFGLLAGFVVSNALRGLSLPSLRSYTGFRLALAGALCGAVALPLLDWLTDRED